MSLESVGLGGRFFFDDSEAAGPMAKTYDRLDKLSGAAAKFARESAKIGKGAAAYAQPPAVSMAVKLQAGLGIAGKAAGSMALALTPVAAAFGLATKSASDFDQKLADIRAASPGITDEALGAMEKKAKQLGMTTTFTASEAADAFLSLSKAGYSSEQSIAAIGGVLNAAAAEGMGLGEATDIVVKTMGAFNLKAEKAGMVSDTLALASAASTTSIADLGAALKYTGLTASQLGFSIQDTAAALATVTNAGIDGTTAGTSLNEMLAKLIDPSSEGGEILKTMGVHLAGANGRMKDMTELVPELSKNLDRFRTPLERSTAVTKLFGIRGAEAFNALDISLKNTTGGSLLDITKQLHGAAGAADRMAKTRMDSFDGSLTMLKNSASELMLEVFEPMLPIFRTVIDGATGFVRGLIERFHALSPAAQGTLTKIGASIAMIVTAAIPLLGAFAAIAFVVGSIASGVAAAGGLAAVGAALGVIAQVAGIVAAVVAAAGLAWHFFSDEIQAFGGGVMDAIGPGIEAFGQLWETLTFKIRTTWEVVVFTLMGTTSGFGINWGRVGRIVGAVLSFIATMVVTVLQAVIELSSWMIISFVRVERFLWDRFEPAFGAIWGTLKQIGTAFDEIFNGGSIISGILRLGAAIVDFVLLPLRSLLGTIAQMGAALGFEGPAAALKGFAEGGFAALIPDTAPAPDSPANNALFNMETHLESIATSLKNPTPVRVESKVKVDGRELALATERHRQEIGERAGFKATPWQRRLAVTTGAIPLGWA